MSDASRDNGRVTTPRVSLGGVPITPFTMKETISALDMMLQSEFRYQVVTVAAWQIALARKDVAFRKAALEADMVLCDGFPVLLASKLLIRSIPERVTGVDSIPLFVELASKRHYSVFVLGSTPEVLETARARLAALYGDFEFGYYCPPFDRRHDSTLDSEMVRLINSAEPDMLYVCLGTPRGEVWANEHFDRLRVKITMGVGGAFDVISGLKPRAPAFLRGLGLEGLYRTVTEPDDRLPRAAIYLRQFPMAVLAEMRRNRRNHGAHQKTGVARSSKVMIAPSENQSEAKQP